MKEKQQERKKWWEDMGEDISNYWIALWKREDTGN
jgi:hypothetical protein